MNGSEYQENRYDIKLNRLFNIQQRRVGLWLVFALVIMVIAMCMRTVTKELSASIVVIELVFGVLSMLTFLTRFPKKLEVTPTTVRFTKKKIHYVYRSYYFTTVKYTVYNITDIQFSQNAFEKLFGVGRVHFIGDLCTITDEYTNDEKSRTVTIYGLGDFQNTAEWMKGFFELAKDRYGE